jgi:hypothetical protein
MPIQHCRPRSYSRPLRVPVSRLAPFWFPGQATTRPSGRVLGSQGSTLLAHCQGHKAGIQQLIRRKMDDRPSVASVALCSKPFDDFDCLLQLNVHSGSECLAAQVNLYVRRNSGPFQ